MPLQKVSFPSAIILTLLRFYEHNNKKLNYQLTLPILQNNNDPKSPNPQTSPHNNQNSPYNQTPPNFGPPSQAHLDPRGTNNFTSPPPFNPHPSTGYSSPAPPPHSSPPPQQPPIYATSPPPPNPQMHYGPPQPQPLIFLGMHSQWQYSGTTSKPIYGPPGSTFDGKGNVYFPYARGHYHEYVGEYRGLNGKVQPTPEERRESDCCWYIFGDDSYYWEDKNR